MKNFLKVTGIIMALLCGAILGYTYVSLNFYDPKDPDVEIDPQTQGYFQNSYDESRSAFYSQVDKLKSNFDSVRTFTKKVPSDIDIDLTIDFCLVPAQKEPKKLLILTSGVHGVEGFVGSAVQQMFMNELIINVLMDEIGVLFVHGINPYGFKYNRRVTENNVDFNRNCDVAGSLFSSENEGYNDLMGMLNPEGEVKVSSMRNRFFMLVAINKLLQESKASLRQAILQGQYEHEKGLYYGGKNFEPQLATLGEVFQCVSSTYETVFNIDLHTGYGERGTTHLFPNPIEDENIKATLENIFEGYKIDWGDSDDFYTINGSFTDYIGKLLADKKYLPMLFEYGTLNSSTTVGSVKSIHNMVMENQGVQFGYKSPKDSMKIKNSFNEMYNPSSQKWRTKVISDSKTLLKQAMKKYADM